MKKLFFIIIPLLLIMACAQENTPESVVRDYYRAMDEEDIELYMSTVSGARADIAGDLLEKFFDNYDVSYTIDTLLVLTKVGDKAQVICVVTAMDEGGPKEFSDNRITVLNKLQRKYGKWTIYDAETSTPIKLDEEGKEMHEPPAEDSLLWKLTLPTG